MNYVSYNFPPEKSLIIKNLASRDWIIHSFKLDDNQSFYNPIDFRYNIDIDNVVYTLYLDTNIYQFILNSYKKKPNQHTQDAIGLLVFCQLSGIQIDPTYAVYEKLNYTKENLPEVITDLDIFNKINNHNTDSLIKYALGESDEFFLNRTENIDRKNLEKSLTKYKKLKEWDSIYLILLACVSIAQKNISNEKKLTMFTNWMISKFRRSLVCWTYAIIYFSQKPIKKMMKYRTTDSYELKKNQLYNMTWDLYIMNTYFRNWIAQKEETEFIYATDDKAFKSILKVAINIQLNRSFTPLKTFVSKSDYANLEEVWNINIPDEERVYQSKKWTPDYRAKLINEFENQLL